MQDLASHHGLAEAVRIAFDQWAVHLRNQKAWAGAMAAYRQALQLMPNDGRLRRNAVATWHGPFQKERSLLRAATGSPVSNVSIAVSVYMAVQHMAKIEPAFRYLEQFD